MPVINGVYLKDFAALPSAVVDANIIPIAISGNQIAYRTTVGGIVTDARVTSKLLTGLSVTGGAIASTDTILQAFGKVQNQINSKVSSVGLTMPSAFSVANSPITSAGTLAVTAIGAASQYIRGDGALADFPTNGGGGSSVSYYLNGSVSQGTIGGNAYYEMNKTPVIGTGTDFTIGADGYIAQFITDANDPASLLIPAGNWNVEMYFSASSSGGTPSFYVEVYKYNGTTFTLLGSSATTPEGITNGTAIDIYYTSVGIPETVLTITDRLAIRVYVTHSGRTITLHTEDNHLSEIVTTFSNGLTALNGLTKQAQYFAVGSTGTDFNISSSVDTHTFNIPDASASNRGLITTGAQTIAGEKTFTASRTIFQNSDFAQITFKNTSDLTKTLNIGYGSNGNIFSSNGLDFRVGGLTSSALLITANENATFKENLTANSFIKSGGTSSQFLKADGTVDSTAYGTGSVTSVAALTLGTSGTDLSSTVANSTTTPVITLNVPDASATARGVVTTGTQTFAGDKTLTGTLYGIGLSMTGTSGDIIGSVATTGKALRGTATTGFGVYASSTTGQAIYAESTGTGGSAVNGTAANGIGGYFFNNSTGFSTLIVSNFGSGNLAQFSNSAGTKFTINNAGNLGNGTYTYTLPSATGTLALTSALSGYLPLTGGTLTGPLLGTTASFTGSAATPITAINTGQRELGLFRTSLDGGYMTFQSSGATTRGYLGNGGGISSLGETSFGIRSESDLILMSGGNNVRLTIASTGAATFSSSVNVNGATNNASYALLVNGNVTSITSAGTNTVYLSAGSTKSYIATSYVGAGSYVPLAFEVGGSERLTITSGGNVGIGTPSPTSFGAGYNTLSINGTTAGVLNLMTNGTDGLRITSDSTITYIYEPRNVPITIWTNATERMRITSGGTILVNKTTARETMIDILNASGKSSINSQVNVNGDNAINWFNASGTYICSIVVNASSVLYNTVSDYRLKQDLKDFQGLNLIDKIKVYDYEWKIDNTRTYGVVAHELQAIIPQAISGVKDAINENGEIKPQGVDYSKIVPILVKAVQELSLEIEELKLLISK